MRSIILTFPILLILILAGCSLFRDTSAPLPKPEMIYVQGGTFTMGDIFEAKNTDALPVHSVTLDDFYLGKYEISLSQFNAYAKRTDQTMLTIDSLQISKKPVANVIWDEAKAYCKYFGFRLPTEQEWEFAARARGKKTHFAGTNYADSLYQYAYVDKPQLNQPLPVGLKQPNTLGIYDMSGNVFEWIGDYYQLYPEKGNKPIWDDLDERKIRIIRGGSYDQPAAVASTYWRAGMLHSGHAP